MTSSADVHVHSKYSDRPSEWILRRIGAPESFVEPLDIYHTARQRGMRFVTVSDHNRIEGALDIAHLPDTFISSEITTYFPEDGCKIHCLVLGITEEQFQVIQQVRSSIYELQAYLVDQDIVHSVAHPLFRVNNRLTVRHVEKLLLLFNCFEGVNGTRDPRASEIALAVLRNLTPQMIDEMANWHGLAPQGPTPWIKSFTAGSDDHSGVYIASAYTTTPSAASVEEFLDHLRRGDHQMGGTSGSSLRLGHSFYSIAYGYYKSRFLHDSEARQSFIGELFRQLLERPDTPTSAPLRDRVRGAANWLVGMQSPGTLSNIERLLIDEFADLFGPHELTSARAAAHPPAADDDQRIFRLACTISQQLGYAFLQKFVHGLQKGRLIESLQTLSSLGPVALSMAPYLAAFHTQHKDERFLQNVATRFSAAQDQRQKSEKKAWVTDTFRDVNGVTRTIEKLGRLSREQGKQLTIITCLADEPVTDLDVKNFRPVGDFELPEYESQRLAIPPLLELIEYFERERFFEIIISTPGPLGLAALAAGRLLGLRVAGIYHTDFPGLVRQLTQDDSLERLTATYMQWFFGQLDTLLVPSNYYLKHLAEQGFAPERMLVMKRGVDQAVFHPQYRDPGFWQAYGLGHAFTFLYVGRISRDKNLDVLLAAFEAASAQGLAAQLVLVGDGPQRNEFSARWQRPDIAFTGAMSGETLARAYASADAFVFPSVTDTFGNAVLEAQASGLPAIVADRGGPQEIIARHQSGLVVDMHQPEILAQTMMRICRDAALYATLAQRALKNASESSWQQVCDDFWQASRRIDLPHPCDEPSTPLHHAPFINWAALDTA